MTRDTITNLAKGDPLIVALGNNWLRRNLGNTLKRKYYTSSRMRGAARLLQHLTELTKSNEEMSYYLCPSRFDLVCEAALLCAHMENDDEEDLRSPSSSIKIGFDVARMAGFKLGMALRDGNANAKQEAEDFKMLMSMEWSVRVSKLAQLKLRANQISKSTTATLPIPEDLSTLGGKVVYQLRKIKYKPELEVYRRAVILLETRLLTYNKRRSGELEAITLDNYKMRSKGLDESDSALFSNDLTDLEKHLCETQELIKIRGKNGRIVPVIVPEDCKRALEFISSTDVRRVVGVKIFNPYLFANTGDAVIRAYDALKIVSSELNLKAPERITSVTLRKYIATLSQVIDMKDHELEWLCQHLGHTSDIHKLHYRATSGFIERVNIGKLMLLQDLNLAGKFAGQKLQDIDISDISQIQGECGENKEVTELQDIQEEILDEDFFEEKNDTKKKNSLKVNSCSTRKIWTLEEEEEVRRLFKTNFSAKTKPKMKECMSAMQTSRRNKGVIHTRNWETIKKKVIRMLK